MDASGGRSVEGDVSRQVFQDLAVDPGLVLGHSGVDSWELWIPASPGKAHHSGLDPPAAVQGHQRAAGVLLLNQRGGSAPADLHEAQNEKEQNPTHLTEPLPSEIRTGTDHVGGDGSIGCVTLDVGDDGKADLLQRLRRRKISWKRTDTTDPI